MTGFLKPFNWVNPVIFSVPSRHYLLLNSPVPVVAGVLAERTVFETQIKPDLASEYETSSYVIVYLDEHHHKLQRTNQEKLESQQPFVKKLMRSDSAKKLMKLIGSKENDMELDKYGQKQKPNRGKDAYIDKEILETSRYLTREFLPPIFDETLLNELREEYVDFQIVFQGGGIPKREFMKERHLQLGLNVSLIIRKMLEDRIIAFLPKSPSLRHLVSTSSSGFSQNASQNHLDYEQISAGIIENNSWDELFLLNFTKTQSFTFYLDKHYRLSPK